MTRLTSRLERLETSAGTDGYEVWWELLDQPGTFELIEDDTAEPVTLTAAELDAHPAPQGAQRILVTYTDGNAE